MNPPVRVYAGEIVHAGEIVYDGEVVYAGGVVYDGEVVVVVVVVAVPPGYCIYGIYTLRHADHDSEAQNVFQEGFPSENWDLCQKML